MKQVITFHSYKGGTGKTTLAANLAALLAKKGNNVCIVDIDVYAPSLGSYFDLKNPRKWINDFLFGNASVDDICVDITKTISSDIKGKLFVSMANSNKEEIYKLDGNISKQGSQMQFLRNFILLREELIMKKNADFIIIDTSPGVRYWSINALAVSDVVLLTLKMGDLDVDGTKRMASEIYGSFTKFGTMCYLLLNRGSGYCTIPPEQHHPLIALGNKGKDGSSFSSQSTQQSTLQKLSRDIDLDIISEIPCYCDIQFSQKEFLTSLLYPEHPFTSKIYALIEKLETND